MARVASGAPSANLADVLDFARGRDALDGQRLAHTLGCSLRATLMYDHPTVEALIAHLDRQLGNETAGAPEARVAGLPSAAVPVASSGLDGLDGLDGIGELSDAEVLARLRR